MRALERQPGVGDIAGADTVADGQWPVDPDLLPPLDSTRVEVGAERGTVVVSTPPRYRPGVWLAIVAIVLVGALAAALVWALTRTHNAPATVSAPRASVPAAGARTVPSLVGRQLADARQQLVARRLPIEVRRTPSRRPRGIVLAQSPGGGARLSSGEKVLVVVAASKASARVTQTTSSAKTQASVPAAVGLSAAMATAALERAGLKVDEVKVPSAKSAGTVVGQSPSTGSRVAPGSTVRIEVAVASGPPKVTMPHVAGLTLQEAMSQLRARGLRADVEHVVSAEPAGTVLGQAPVSGAQLRRGMTVTLRVAAAPAKVDIPDVTGLDAASARQQLIDSGFRVQIDNQPVTDASQDGVVIDESPAVGSRAAKGSTVTITVGQATSQ